MLILRFEDQGRTDCPIIRQRLLVGRSSICDLVINSPNVSRTHAEITISNGQVYLSDTGSSNGTFVNGKRIASRYRLQPGDRISFAEITAILHAPGKQQSPKLAQIISRIPKPAWGLFGGVLAALLLFAIMLPWQRHQRPIFSGGGDVVGGRTVSVPASSKPEPQAWFIPDSTSSPTGPTLSNWPQLPPELKTAAESIMQPPVAVIERQKQNPRPWESVSMPKEPLPVIQVAEMPTWLEPLGLKAEWFDGLDVSLTQGKIRAAIPAESIEKIMDSLSLANNDPASGIGVRLQTVAYHPGVDRRDPYLEINAHFEIGLQQRIFGHVRLRPPDVPAGDDYSWIENCQPLFFDLFVSGKNVLWGTISAPRIAVTSIRGNESFQIDNLLIEATDLSFNYPDESGTIRARVGAFALKDGTEEIRIGASSLGYRVPGRNPFSPWHLNLQVGAVSGAENGEKLMALSGVKLMTGPLGMSNQRAAIGGQISLGSLEINRGAGLSTVWNHLEGGIQLTALRQPMLEAYRNFRKQSAGLQGHVSPRAQREMREHLQQLLANILVGGGRIDYRFEVQASKGRELEAQAILDWSGAAVAGPENYSMNELERLGTLDMRANGDEALLRDLLASRGNEKMVDRGIANGELKRLPGGKIRLELHGPMDSPKPGVAKMTAPPVLRGGAEYLPEKSVTKETNPGGFKIYSPDGEEYLVKIQPDVNQDLYAGSAPFLNIIQDARDYSQPGDIDPEIGVEGLSLFRSGDASLLPWEEALPAISRSMVLMPSQFEIFPPSEFEVHSLSEGGDFYLPRIFRKFLTNKWIEADLQRRGMYAKVLLDVFTSADFTRALLDKGIDLEDVWAGTFFTTWLDFGVPLDEVQKAVGITGLGQKFLFANLADQRDLDSKISALEHGQVGSQADLSTIVDKINQRMAQRWGKALKGIKWLGIGLKAVRSGRDAAINTAIMAKAAEMSVVQSQAEVIVSVLENSTGIDPMMVKGANDALELLDLLQQDRFNAYQAAILSASASVGGSIAKEAIVKIATREMLKKVPYLKASRVASGAAAGVIVGLVEVGIDVFKTSQRASYLGCLCTVGRVMVSQTEQLLEGEMVGKLLPGKASLASLIHFNHKAAYLAHLTLNRELFYDRPLSKIVAYEIKARLHPGLKTSLLNSEQQLMNILLMEARVDTKRAILMEQVRKIYNAGREDHQIKSSDVIAANVSSVRHEDILGKWRFGETVCLITRNSYSIYNREGSGTAHYRIKNIDNDTISMELIDGKMAVGNIRNIKVKEKGRVLIIQDFFGPMEDEWVRIE